MAKIEMDISEYEAMKENKKLLENSLEKERGLQEQIKKLTDEKTKALENAKMKVVKISKTEITEHLMRKKEDGYIWRELCHLLGLDYRTLPKMPDYIHTDHLAKVFFEKTTSYSMPYEETTTHGLDEIKAEIRNDLKEKMDEETNRKIKNAETALSKNDELLKENLTLTSENNILTEKNNKLTEQCDELTKKLTEIEDGNKVLSGVKDILKNGYGFWNKSELLDKIISIIK
jgi:predicted nuclease with TOPRIM domain